MDSVLIDTDVFSFFFRQDSRQSLYAPEIEGRRACLSFQNVAELLRWAAERGWGAPRRESLGRAMGRYVVLPLDGETARLWAEITVGRKRTGNPVSCGDAWIAATALRYGISLVTHNGGHFKDVPGLRVICHAPGF